MSRRILFSFALGSALLLSAAASAAPITMDPNPLSVTSILGGELSIRLDSGDSDTNLLSFSIETQPRVLDLVAIAFDAEVLGVDIVSDPNHIVPFGLAEIGGNVFGTVIDLRGDPTSARFDVQLAATPTSATVYTIASSLFDQLGDIDSLHDLHDLEFHEAHELRFSVEGGGGGGPAVPEPSAALVFSLGIWVAFRRR